MSKAIRNCNYDSNPTPGSDLITYKTNSHHYYGTNARHLEMSFEDGMLPMPIEEPPKLEFDYNLEIFPNNFKEKKKSLIPQSLQNEIIELEELISASFDESEFY